MHMTVERVSYLHESEIDEQMNKIKHSLRPDEPNEALVVRRAATLVRNGSVESYTYDSSNRTVVATIKGVETVEVQLSFATMDTACTCGFSGWCSHRIAVVFHLYLQFHSLSDWLHEWKRTETEQMVFAISERTPEAWNDVLSRLTRPLRTIELNENPAVFIHEFSLIDQKAIPLAPFEWEWKPLFDVYYRLQVLDAAWPYVYAHLGDDESSFSYGKWYVKNWLTDQLSKLQDSAVAVASKPKLFQTDPFHEQLKFMTRTFTLKNTGLFNDRFRVYQSFWQHLFSDNALRQKEQSILLEENSPEASILIAFFYVLESRHEQLEELVRDVTIDSLSNWLPLANLADDEEDMDSLAIIMQSLLPFIGEYLAHSVPLSRRTAFVRKIDGLLEIADFPEDERESMFSYYGETGVDVYADFLVERERFQEWAALMHRYNVSYDVAEAGGLKIALAVDPAAVLPLLHTYATFFINERNRHSYRRAVKLFKKMKSGSKKSGKIDFWNRYVDTVREKNRRLRALMEEMEKGNLNL
ncbi:SWIM zinc finger family protein [Sporosarcina sp. G11-34]|uniref:SWIM zinc finger family protein n=1 Tax=Sporosarcina sp. G11-34 TaxID=2849605 RepID=UPI0022A9CA44|nr:SWIM zinc finger family protein [Sporosarcina sp. G11-34]MCZ2257558.1 SWIM zinc finger family protein [Sporosarcina sp. G11-34]